jgi:hypothetical protein
LRFDQDEIPAISPEPWTGSHHIEERNFVIGRLDMRRYFQMRLSTAMVLLTACALPCGWLSANLRQWQAERAALAAIGPASVQQANKPIPIFC